MEAAGSIVGDLLAVTVPASGNLFGDPYRFAADSPAGKQPGVHRGFGLAALILPFDPDHGILATLKAFHAREPIRDILVAGHRQGAAIATLVGSFLHDYGREPFSGFQRKISAYAQPKPGNDHDAADYTAIHGNGGMGITINKSEDWVPQVPLTLQRLADLDTPHPIRVALPRSPLQELEHILMKPLGLDLEGVREAAKLSHHQGQAKRRDSLHAILQRQILEPRTGDEGPLPESCSP